MSELKEIYELSAYSKEFKNKTTFSNTIGSPVYGEITENGTNSLINYFKEYFNKDAVFYDLGCGLGKMVMHIGLYANIKKSCGIEYSNERFKGCQYLQQKYAKNNNNIEFYNKSFLEHDISNATIIYIDNTCFSQETMKSIYDKVPKNCLFIFKKYLGFEYTENIVTVNDLCERTYKQSGIQWLIKD